MEADIPIWRKPGYFYFALTSGAGGQRLYRLQHLNKRNVLFAWEHCYRNQRFETAGMNANTSPLLIARSNEIATQALGNQRTCAKKHTCHSRYCLGTGSARGGFFLARSSLVCRSLE
jgi:hypothetical protein